MRGFKYSMQVVLLLAMISSIHYAQSMPVPPKVQAALYKKIFTFDKSLSGSPKILVVFGDADAKDQMVAAFKELGFNAVGVKADQLAGQLGQNVVVYLTPGSPSVKTAAAKAGSLTITGVPSLIDNGQASIGIGTDAGKPRILVNMEQLKAEKHDLSAEFLKLAKIVKMEI